MKAKTQGIIIADSIIKELRELKYKKIARNILVSLIRELEMRLRLF